MSCLTLQGISRRIRPFSVLMCTNVLLDVQGNGTIQLSILKISALRRRINWPPFLSCTDSAIGRATSRWFANDADCVVQDDSYLFDK